MGLRLNRRIYRDTLASCSRSSSATSCTGQRGARAAGLPDSPII